MRTIISLVIASMISLSAIAGGSKDHPDKYCVKMKDGKKVVMHMGSPLTSAVTLSNGSRIQTDGTVVKADGTTVTVRVGECISKDGGVAEEEHKGNKRK
jgi:hypothetical protein